MSAWRSPGYGPGAQVAALPRLGATNDGRPSSVGTQRGSNSRPFPSMSASTRDPSPPYEAPEPTPDIVARPTVYQPGSSGFSGWADRAAAVAQERSAGVVRPIQPAHFPVDCKSAHARRYSSAFAAESTFAAPSYAPSSNVSYSPHHPSPFAHTRPGTGSVADPNRFRPSTSSTMGRSPGVSAAEQYLPPTLSPHRIGAAPSQPWPSRPLDRSPSAPPATAAARALLLRWANVDMSDEAPPTPPPEVVEPPPPPPPPPPMVEAEVDTKELEEEAAAVAAAEAAKNAAQQQDPALLAASAAASKLADEWSDAAAVAPVMELVDGSEPGVLVVRWRHGPAMLASPLTRAPGVPWQARDDGDEEDHPGIGVRSGSGDHSDEMSVVVSPATRIGNGSSSARTPGAEFAGLPIVYKLFVRSLADPTDAHVIFAPPHATSARVAGLRDGRAYEASVMAVRAFPSAPAVATFVGLPTPHRPNCVVAVPYPQTGHLEISWRRGLPANMRAASPVPVAKFEVEVHTIGFAPLPLVARAQLMDTTGAVSFAVGNEVESHWEPPDFDGMLDSATLIRSIEVLGTETTAVITGLPPNTWYTAVIRASNAAGVSKPSEPAVATPLWSHGACAIPGCKGPVTPPLRLCGAHTCTLPQCSEPRRLVAMVPVTPNGAALPGTAPSVDVANSGTAESLPVVLRVAPQCGASCERHVCQAAGCSAACVEVAPRFENAPSAPFVELCAAHRCALPSCMLPNAPLRDPAMTLADDAAIAAAMGVGGSGVGSMRGAAALAYEEPAYCSQHRCSAIADGGGVTQCSEASLSEGLPLCSHHLMTRWQAALNRLIHSANTERPAPIDFVAAKAKNAKGKPTRRKTPASDNLSFTPDSQALLRQIASVLSAPWRVLDDVHPARTLLNALPWSLSAEHDAHRRAVFNRFAIPALRQEPTKTSRSPSPARGRARSRKGPAPHADVEAIQAQQQRVLVLRGYSIARAVLLSGGLVHGPGDDGAAALLRSGIPAVDADEADATIQISSATGLPMFVGEGGPMAIGLVRLLPMVMAAVAALFVAAVDPGSKGARTRFGASHQLPPLKGVEGGAPDADGIMTSTVPEAPTPPNEASATGAAAATSTDVAVRLRRAVVTSLEFTALLGLLKDVLELISFFGVDVSADPASLETSTGAVAGAWPSITAWWGNDMPVSPTDPQTLYTRTPSSSGPGRAPTVADVCLFVACIRRGFMVDPQSRSYSKVLRAMGNAPVVAKRGGSRSRPGSAAAMRPGTSPSRNSEASKLPDALRPRGTVVASVMGGPEPPAAVKEAMLAATARTVVLALGIGVQPPGERRRGAGAPATESWQANARAKATAMAHFLRNDGVRLRMSASAALSRRVPLPDPPHGVQPESFVCGSGADVVNRAALLLVPREDAQLPNDVEEGVG